MEHYAFVVARPLQIITAISICQQVAARNVDFIVVGWFTDSEMITERLKVAYPHFHFHLESDYKSAIRKVRSIKYTELFLHWDVGFQTNIFIAQLMTFNPNARLSIFEEGIGTYRTDIYPPVKRRLFKWIGLPTNIGGSKFTSRIYLYDKKKYEQDAGINRPRDVLQMHNSPLQFYEGNRTEMHYVFDPNSFLERIADAERGGCVIYLSNWNYKEREEMGYFEEGSTNVLKLHPYCAYEVIHDFGGMLAPRGLPAELLIYSAINNYDSVTVVHKNSSVQLYATDDKVKFINAA